MIQQPPLHEAIIYVHGADADEPGKALEEFVQNAKECYSTNQLEVVDNTEASMYEMRRIKIIPYGDEKERVVDVYEFYWGNFRSSVFGQSVLGRLWDSTNVVFFWTRWRFFKPSARDLPKRALMFTALAIMLCWYWSILAAAFIWLWEYLGYMDVPGINGDFFVDLAEFFGFENSVQEEAKAKWWLAIPLLVGGIFTSWAWFISMVDVLHFIRRYLSQASLRNRISRRLKDMYHEVHAVEKYERITFVGNSFGSAIMSHFLAHEELLVKDTEVRVVSFGAAISFFKQRAPEVGTWVKKAVNNLAIAGWKDFYSPRDWLSSEEDLAETAGIPRPGFESVKLAMNRGLLNRISNHGKYTSNREVLGHLFDSA